MSGFKHIAPLFESRFGIKSDDAYRELADAFDGGLRGRNFNELLDARNISYEEDEILLLVEAYRSHSPGIALSETTMETLSSLAKQYKLGLLTDGYLVAQEKKVQSLGLAGFMRAILFTDELGRKYWKPRTKPYKRVIEELVERPGSSIYFEITPRKTSRAKEVGMLTVQVLQWSQRRSDNLDESYHPHLFVKKVSDIPDLIEEINRKVEGGWRR